MSWFFGPIDAKLNQIINQQAKIISLLTKGGATVMGIKEDVDALVSEVEQNTTVVSSVQTLLTGLTETLNTLKGQITDPAAAAALSQAIATLDANNKALADAVAANTPAASG